MYVYQDVTKKYTYFKILLITSLLYIAKACYGVKEWNDSLCFILSHMSTLLSVSPSLEKPYI